MVQSKRDRCQDRFIMDFKWTICFPETDSKNSVCTTGHDSKYLVQAAPVSSLHPQFHNQRQMDRSKEHWGVVHVACLLHVAALLCRCCPEVCCSAPEESYHSMLKNTLMRLVSFLTMEALTWDRMQLLPCIITQLRYPLLTSKETDTTTADFLNQWKMLWTEIFHRKTLWTIPLVRFPSW